MRFPFLNIVGILLKGSSVRVCLVVLNQGCCGSGQCNLGCCDLMLIQSRIKVMYWSLLWLTLHITAGISIFHRSIPGIVEHIFFLSVIVLTCFLCSYCISKTLINLTRFLFKSKFLFFQMCDSAHLLSHYYYYYIYYFSFYLLLLLLFSTCLFCYYFEFSLLCNVKILLILVLPS